MDEFAFQLSYWDNYLENAFWQKRWKEEILTSWTGAEQGLWCGRGRRMQVWKPSGGQVTEGGN